MQHLIRRLILFLSLAATVGILPQKAFATHLAGSDITYTCLGGNSYRVDVTFYRDCSGTIAPPSLIVDFHSTSCNMDFTDALLPVAGTGQEITYPCPGLTTTCDDTTSINPGIQQYRYSGIINFPMQCADWVISWEYCCRNCDITTISIPQPCVSQANPGMYISANLDNLNYTCNSSPYFSNNPIVFVCIGQNFTYNHGAIDPDGDSLVYSFIPSLIDATTPVPYLPGYSATTPVTSVPGITINPTTGDIVINPTTQEVGVLSVLVEEYRNGVLIGHVIRDMEIYVRACTNNIPSASGMNGTAVHDSTICPNTQICFDVFSDDLDAGQIVTMSWNQQIVGATFTISGFPHPVGHFCWTPTVSDISPIPHQFTVSVVDNACPNSGYQAYAFTILVNSPLVNINVTDISCHGALDGSITVVPVNPGNGFSYLWAPGGQTTAGISNLSPGSYPVTVFDSTTGCSATFPNTITDPPLLTDSAFSITASCTGASSGAAGVVASGGTPSYTYTWNTIPPSYNDTASGIPPGNYTVIVTDSHGCSVTDSVTVNSSSSALIISVVDVDTLLCYTDTSGTITVSVSGGTPGYTYLWNTTPPQTGPTATGLSPGPYTVTITDTVGCSSSVVATVQSPPLLVLVGSAIPASCTLPDGAAIITASGGTPGYTYSWAGFPSVDDTLPNVIPGLYNVTVTDSNACVQNLDVLVGSQIISTNAGAISPVSCNGDSNAVAVVVASGGTAPYTYTWNTIPPQLNDTVTGLHAGLYIVSITDSNNCFTVDTVHIPDPPVLNISISIVNASCAGDSSGTATVHVSGGTLPYSYSWSPYGGIDSVATQLIPGSYNVIVTDGSGCVYGMTDSVQQNTTIVLTVDGIIQPNCNGANTGSIDISVSGGTPGYTYTWVPGNFNTQDLSNIDAGNYQVTITDAHNCTVQQIVTVSQPPPVPSYAGADTAICAGGSIQLNADLLSGGNIGVWSSLSVPDSLFSDLNDPNATVTNVPPGFNTITWTVTDANGCSSSDDVSVFNFNLSAGSDTSICGLIPVQLNAGTAPGLTGIWTASTNVIFNDSTLYNAIATLINYGIDTLTWTISGSACITSDYVVVAEYENTIADAGDSSTVCEAKAKIIAVVTPPGTGVWTVLAPSTATIIDPLNPVTDVENLNQGISVFVWTMTNGACSAADTVLVNFDILCDLDLPTAFSPNGDLYNDGYYIRGIESYPYNTFRVFNRWGNEVYTKEDYTNTDWIGQNNSGDVLPEGTYYVLLTIKDQDIKKSTYVDLRRYAGK